MPFVTVPTNSGPVDFHYEISTPTNHSASEIDSSLPTIFFIHAAYTSHEIFEREPILLLPESDTCLMRLM